MEMIEFALEPKKGVSSSSALIRGMSQKEVFNQNPKRCLGSGRRTSLTKPLQNCSVSSPTLF